MKFKLIKHNSDDQRKWSSNDDTNKYLIVGNTYEGEKEVHSYHTKIIIDGKKFNSVCFEEIDEFVVACNEEIKSLMNEVKAHRCMEKRGNWCLDCEIANAKAQGIQFALNTPSQTKRQYKWQD